jgi:hypothetical protein
LDEKSTCLDEPNKKIWMKITENYTWTQAVTTQAAKKEIPSPIWLSLNP